VNALRITISDLPVHGATILGLESFTNVGCTNLDVELGSRDDGNVTRNSLDTEDKSVTKENAIGEDGKCLQ
jgi:hypothetical protein